MKFEHEILCSFRGFFSGDSGDFRRRGGEGAFSMIWRGSSGVFESHPGTPVPSAPYSLSFITTEGKHPGDSGGSISLSYQWNCAQIGKKVLRLKGRVEGNPKFQARNSKQVQKLQNPNVPNQTFLNLEFWIWDLFRISIFGFFIALFGFRLCRVRMVLMTARSLRGKGEKWSLWGKERATAWAAALFIGADYFFRTSSTHFLATLKLSQ